MSSSLRFTVLESMIVLALSYAAVRFVFPRIASWAMRCSPPRAEGPPLEIQREVRRGVAIAARNLPWKSVCLPRAIAGKMLLARRGYDSTVHLGVGLEKGALTAHAWLTSGEAILIGAKGSENLSMLL